MNEFRFDFSLAKLVHSIAFFSVSGWNDLTKLKLAKLLYFADKMHLLEFASPVLGDVYYCMDWGPVPSFALNEMNEAISRSDAEADAPDIALMDSVLKVHKPFLSKYPLFEARHRDYDKSVFSDSELSVLQRVSSEFGRYSARDLVALTHKEPTWCIPNADRPSGSRTQISYDLFFVDCNELGKRNYAQLVARFRGEVIPLPGDADYRDFASSLIDGDPDMDWSIDKDQSPRRALQSFG
jgi:uncharacterized phage-associated protein